MKTCSAETLGKGQMVGADSKHHRCTVAVNPSKTQITAKSVERSERAVLCSVLLLWGLVFWQEQRPFLEDISLLRHHLGLRISYQNELAGAYPFLEAPVQPESAARLL